MIVSAKYNKGNYDGSEKSLVKGYVDLFRKIAQSNNTLPVSQLKNRSEYRRIMKLIPRSELEIPGTTILYFEDFIEENKVKIKYLKRRLRAIYGHSLHIKNWRQVTLTPDRQSLSDRVLLLVEELPSFNN